MTKKSRKITRKGKCGRDANATGKKEPRKTANNGDKTLTCEECRKAVDMNNTVNIIIHEIPSSQLQPGVARAIEEVYKRSQPGARVEKLLRPLGKILSFLRIFFGH
jgi:hypothetical protein